MLNSITIGRYYHKNSLIHQMHPFAKVLCTFCYVLIVVLFRDLFFLLLLLLFVLLLALMSRIPLLVYARTIWSLKYFILMIAIFSFLVRDNWLDVVFPVFRLILIVFYSSLLTLTTSPNQLAKGLEMFLRPLLLFRVPVKQIALSLVHAIRFIPVVLDVTNNVIKAQRSRFINQELAYQERAKNALWIIKPVFLKSFEKAGLISNSMAQRLYNLHQDRTFYEITKVKFFDIYMIVVHVTILIAIIYRLVIG